MDIPAEAKKLLEANRRTTDGHQYTVPSIEHYPYQWLWDSCFHAIILAQYEPEAARAELQSLLSRQFDDGMVPHIIYWQPGPLHFFRWGVEGTSSLTQPPMIAYAAWEIHRRASEQGFLESIYEQLLAYYKFLVEKRDPQGEHLAGIINPDESGEDNSPRFDEPLSAPPDIGYLAHHNLREKLVDENTANNFDVKWLSEHGTFWVKDVLFNTVLVENLRALSHIASILEHEEGEQFANRYAELIASAMRKKLFDGRAFRSVYGIEDRPLRANTWVKFAPLFAGLYSDEEARRLVKEELFDETTFWSSFGMRTTSKREAAYRAEGFADHFSWRGPVWMVPHWFVYHGLQRYGFTDEAARIREKCVALIEHSGFRECFNPETGEGEGAQGFTWGALILDMNP
jgi:glycogen debranching enzyme